MSGPHFDKLLILDLDHTLICSSSYRLAWPAHAALVPYYVYHRPGLDHFLEFALTSFARVGIWTAGSAPYAFPIVGTFLDDLSRLEFLWTRERCVPHISDRSGQLIFLKDLRDLQRAGYRLSDVLFVDDIPGRIDHAHAGVITIPPFYGDPQDRELPAMTARLRELGAVALPPTPAPRLW